MEQLQEKIEELKLKIKNKQDEAEKASRLGDDETLSLSIVSLARINSALSQRAAYAKYIARNSARVVEKLKEDKDTMRARLTLQYSSGQAVNKSELQAKIEAAEKFGPEVDKAFKVYSEAMLIADEADSLAFRTDTYLKLAQTRVSLLKGDKARG